MPLSDELLKKCFPSVEIMLSNLEYAINKAVREKNATLLAVLQKCRKYLEEKDFSAAAAASEAAGYYLMARAIRKFFSSPT